MKHIRIISPSGVIAPSFIDGAVARLRAWGYKVSEGAHARDTRGRFAGTDDDRLADLTEALNDPSVDAILCSRGGYGLQRIIDRVPAIHKPVIGFSDITALHSAMVQAGVMSIHGSMLHAISSQNGTDSVSVMLHNILEGTLPTYYLEHNALDQPGCAEGLLVGGNFSVLCGLAGSPYDCLLRREPLILFIEDTDEEMTKVDRMLHHLEVRGVLQRLKGIIVGHFTDYKRPKNDFEDMNEMLHSYLSELDIPVCYGFPVGHKRPNLPLIEGCRVRLTVSDTGTSLTFLQK